MEGILYDRNKQYKQTKQTKSAFSTKDQSQLDVMRQLQRFLVAVVWSSQAEACKSMHNFVYFFFFYFCCSTSAPPISDLDTSPTSFYAGLLENLSVYFKY